MKFIFVLLFTIMFSSLNGFAQKWYNPQDAEVNPVEGQFWQGEPRTLYYNRFPDSFESKVSPAVWGLSKQSAGVSIRFKSNSSKITVRYKLTSPNSIMAHMPRTGSSGVDLYGINGEGKSVWIAGRFSFSDTTVYNFGPITYRQQNHSQGYEYQLFLPTYNGVEWLEIGVDENAMFEFCKTRKEKPIVVYGTSITQGACASRPGMIWASILSRHMDMPLYNYGFSGSGLLEDVLIDMISEIDAAVYIIDCMPNLYAKKSDELTDLIVKQMKALRTKRPNTPIVLADHLGYPHSDALEHFRAYEENAIKSQKAAYDRLIADGMKNIYHLDYATLGMPGDATVEAIHPTDWGMQVYATAYEELLRRVLNMPIGDRVTTIPVRQRREPDTYEWMDRHEHIVSESKTGIYNKAIVGNSIIHHWGGVDGFKICRAPNVWNNKMKKYLNVGCGWDRIENVLWRVYHGELEGAEFNEIILKIGTNNLSVNHSDEDIVIGLENLISAIHIRQPKAKLKVLGILPRRGMEERVKILNAKIANNMKKVAYAHFSDVGVGLLQTDGKINETMFVDGLHPSESGYKIIAKEIRK